MFTKLKKELNTKPNLSFQKKKAELQIESSMNSEVISELIADKLIKIIRKNVC